MGAVRTGIGQDSHRFEETRTGKPLVLGGVIFGEATRGLSGNSDADVVLHALTNAVSGVTGVNILGEVADKLCRSGLTDSSLYLKEALKHLGSMRILHISITIEAKDPKISPMVSAMRRSISELAGVPEDGVCITATTGEGLTSFGRGEGIQAFAIVTASQTAQ